jgi:hypothetical protein
MSFMRSSIETPDYEVLRVLTRKAEIRRYPSLILAQTQMNAAPYSQNSSTGFRRVAGYIFGGNEQGQKRRKNCANFSKKRGLPIKRH